LSKNTTIGKFIIMALRRLGCGSSIVTRGLSEGVGNRRRSHYRKKNKEGAIVEKKRENFQALMRT